MFQDEHQAQAAECDGWHLDGIPSMFFEKKKIADEQQVSGNQELVLPEKSKELHDVVVAFTYVVFKERENAVVKLGFIKNKNPSRDINKCNQRHNEKRNNNGHFN